MHPLQTECALSDAFSLAATENISRCKVFLFLLKSSNSSVFQELFMFQRCFVVKLQERFDD